MFLIFLTQTTFILVDLFSLQNCARRFIDFVLDELCIGRINMAASICHFSIFICDIFHEIKLFSENNNIVTTLRCSTVYFFGKKYLDERMRKFEILKTVFINEFSYLLLYNFIFVIRLFLMCLKYYFNQFW